MGKKLQFFSKKGGCFQFNFVKQNETVLDSYVFVEAAKNLPNSERCDWENKVKFKLGETDISSILTFLENVEKKMALIHKYKDKTTYMNIDEGLNGSIKVQLGDVSLYAPAIDRKKLQIFMDEALRKIYID